MKQELTYIFCVACPIDNSIKFIGVGKSYKVPTIINRSPEYHEWLEILKNKKLQPKFIIIDKVSTHLNYFWLDFYRDLFRSWGIELWEHSIKERMRRYTVVRKEQKAKILSNRLLGENETLGVLDVGIFVYAICNIIDNAEKSRELDEFILMIIHTFFYGQSLNKISEFTFDNLYEYMIIKENSNEHLRFKKIERYMRSYYRIYSLNQASDSLIFKKIIDSKQLELKLERIMQFFGQHTKIYYSDHIWISKLLLYKINKYIRINKNELHSLIGIKEEYLKYKLLSKRTNFILLDSSDLIETLLN